MKSTLMVLTLLVAVFGLTTLALASDTVFDSKSYLQGEAGVIGPLEKMEEHANLTVSVPIAVWLGDRNNFYRFEEEKNTNLSGPAPDFARDYISGEAGIVNPIELPMEK